jgi:hypothetical protein
MEKGKLKNVKITCSNYKNDLCDVFKSVMVLTFHFGQQDSTYV